MRSAGSPDPRVLPACAGGCSWGSSPRGSRTGWAAPGATRPRCSRSGTMSSSRRSRGRGGERRRSGFSRASTPSRPRRDLTRAGVIAVCRHSLAFPTRLLQLHDPPAVLFTKGDVTGGLRPAVPHAGRGARGQQAGLAARARDGARARSGARGVRDHRRQRPGPGRRRRRARGGARRPGLSRRGAGRWPRRGLPADERQAAPADRRHGAGHVGAAARPAPVSLELSRAQPDHGRALRGDRRGRGRRGVRFAHHERVRRGPRPDRGSRTRARRAGRGRGAAMPSCGPGPP